MRVLIVDDSLLAEFALKNYFEKLGHKVVALAKTGEIAKSKFKETKPDLVTVDQVMPGISGLELIKYINRQDNINGKLTKIIMISSNSIVERDNSDIRIDKYLKKPVTLKKLRNALTTM